MIRRDYILRMIEECIRALARINALKQGQRWNEASDELDAEFKKLLGEGAPAVARLSETDLLTRLMQEGPTHALRDKTLILTTLLKEAGDVAAAAERTEESREYYLKALHLLLDVLARGEVFECPEFVPKVEMLKKALRETPLSARMQALLMQHYERTGEFAKAEDAFHALLDTDPANEAIVEFGIAFYQRLLTHSEPVLNEANLPRVEVQEGLKELQGRQKPLPSAIG
jgi:tetratricopeptide (TPR) repeat protein